MHTITKQELGYSFGVSDPSIPKSLLSKIVDGVFSHIESELSIGKRFPIQNIGRINVLVKSARPGRNLQTGIQCLIDPRLSITCTENSPAKGALSSRLDFYKFLKREFQLTQISAKNVFRVLVGKINSVLTGQYKVAIQGFGTFEPRVKKSIKVRNPITKNVHTKSAYIFCHFRASDQLRKRLENSGNFILP